MDPTPSIALIVAVLVLLPAAGLVIGVLFAMSRLEEELGSLGGFEGIHFET
jgi:hypothetical protein